MDFRINAATSTILLVTTLAACAPYASDVRPVLDTSIYSCDDLRERFQNKAGEVAVLSDLQDRSATDDIYSIAVLGFPIPARDGADKQRLAVAKGQFNAMQQAYARCEQERLVEK